MKSQKKLEKIPPEESPPDPKPNPIPNPTLTLTLTPHGGLFSGRGFLTPFKLYLNNFWGCF